MLSRPAKNMTKERGTALLAMSTKALRKKMLLEDDFDEEQKAEVREALVAIDKALLAYHVANVNWKSMLRMGPTNVTYIQASRIVSALRFERNNARRAVIAADRAYEAAVRGPIRIAMLAFEIGTYIKERLEQPSFMERILPVVEVKKNKKSRTKLMKAKPKKPTKKKSPPSKRGVKRRK